jgi:hypothetical protein
MPLLPRHCCYSCGLGLRLHSISDLPILVIHAYELLGVNEGAKPIAKVCVSRVSVAKALQQ